MSYSWDRALEGDYGCCSECGSTSCPSLYSDGKEDCPNPTKPEPVDWRELIAIAGVLSFVVGAISLLAITLVYVGWMDW